MTKLKNFMLTIVLLIALFLIALVPTFAKYVATFDMPTAPTISTQDKAVFINSSDALNGDDFKVSCNSGSNQIMLSSVYNINYLYFFDTEPKNFTKLQVDMNIGMISGDTDTGKMGGVIDGYKANSVKQVYLALYSDNNLIKISSQPIQTTPVLSTSGYIVKGFATEIYDISNLTQNLHLGDILSLTLKLVDSSGTLYSTIDASGQQISYWNWGTKKTNINLCRDYFKAKKYVVNLC